MNHVLFFMVECLVQGTAVVCYSGDETQEKEMGGACGTWGGGEKEENIRGFGGETLRKALFKT
jgi:hypothetical protein